MESHSNENIFRKLSAGELVYDYEIKLKGCILPFSCLFNSTHDLFKEKNSFLTKCFLTSFSVWASLYSAGSLVEK